jgi:hypothetical protein
LFSYRDVLEQHEAGGQYFRVVSEVPQRVQCVLQDAQNHDQPLVIAAVERQRSEDKERVDLDLGIVRELALRRERVGGRASHARRVSHG